MRAAGTVSPTQSYRLYRVYYARRDRKYEGWGLHAWGNGVKKPTSWDEAAIQTGQDSDGCFWDILIQDGSPAEVGLIVHKGDEKSAGGSLRMVPQGQSEVWLVADCEETFLDRDAATARPTGSLARASAHWVSADVILWRHDVADGAGNPYKFRLLASKHAGLSITPSSVTGSDIELELVPAESNRLPPALLSKFPHLDGCTVFQLHKMPDYVLRELVCMQLGVEAIADDGLVQATGVQIAGVLDDRFAYDGPLGDVKGELTVWAPTAQNVELLHYQSARGGEPEVIQMQKATETGAWSAYRPEAWDKTFYQYRVTVYHHDTQKIECIHSSDPYSRGLSADGERSMFVNLSTDASLMPLGWLQHRSPPIRDVMDTSVYELHVRDFSASDASVPARVRGKYLAFDVGATKEVTQGQAHLQRLQEAGLTHVHLLPTFDFGSVPERPEDQREPPDNLHTYESDSESQQEEIMKVHAVDAFNWGYDPVHYGVPEGSYACDADSPDRILEYRNMVKALHAMKLRVVVDVVYNHTFASGLNTHSVLDKIVPGYYYRRMENGEYCNSTCCNNTATEHKMCERLMVDDLVHWAKHYRVDGFRFDIMGHILVSSMLAARAALDALTLERDGVDGKAVYLYGEAWDFGEVANNQRGRNASQLNITGTGLGGFNDRVRNGAMGPGFGHPSSQGALTGIGTAPNGVTSTAATAADDARALLDYMDWIRLGMAGNLREYRLVTGDGRERVGKEIFFGTSPAAYCAQPSENVLYLSCHDNETLFDQVMLKLEPSTSIEERVRVCELAHGLIAVSQGIAFYHAGDDLLRSKSLDRDSYSSGDWFNKLDWTGQHNNFGVGLPPASKNAASWPLHKALLSNAALVPSPALIQRSRDFFLALLRVRYSSPLFRLPSADAICSQVEFFNTGPDQVPGVVFMHIKSADTGAADHAVHDPKWQSIVVVINASPASVELALPPSMTGSVAMHPQMTGLPHAADCGIDLTKRTVSVGGRAMVVACEARSAA